MSTKAALQGNTRELAPAPCSITFVIRRTRKLDGVRFARDGTRAIYKLLPFFLFSHGDIECRVFRKRDIREARYGIGKKPGEMSRNRGTESKITTHTPSAGPIWVSGRLESSIDSEPDCLASDKPRFRFRDDGVVDITVRCNLRSVHS